MHHKELKVIFEPSGRTVYVLPGTPLLEAAAEAGFILETPCGGVGKCGKCLVHVRVGRCPPTAEEGKLLSPAQREEGFRLACCSKIVAPITVEIPDTSLFQNQAKILTHDTRETLDIHPAIRKCSVSLTPPDHGDTHSDLELLHGVLGPFTPTLEAVRHLPRVLRQSSFRIHAVIAGETLVAIEPESTDMNCYGVAFDIGSTTLVGTLVNLGTGADCAIAARMNPQTSFGDDVISRIQKCRTEKDGLAKLQKSVIDAINKIISEVSHSAKIPLESIYEVAMAGNTTMQQILCGIDPSALGEIPFLPAFSEPLQGNASDLGIKINAGGRFYVFPQIGGFVGGDTVAGIIATRLDRYQAPALFVDIGTNGEIVLVNRGKLTATSVAAGPAFEGARIVNGMRGANGAIEKVILNGAVEWNVIGNTKPSGICGTGLIDAAAELLRAGILDTTGRILGPDEVSADLAPELKRRLVVHGSEVDFLLVEAKESATGQPLYLYQKDIRELQLANAAIRAGINILLRHAGLEPEALSHILLAGAFGNYIRRNNAKRLGMLPPIPCERIQYVGNTASFGAKRVLLSTVERKRTADITRTIRHLDLSLDPEFQMDFSEAMIFPEQVEEDCP